MDEIRSVKHTNEKSKKASNPKRTRTVGIVALLLLGAILPGLAVADEVTVHVQRRNVAGVTTPDTRVQVAYPDPECVPEMASEPSFDPASDCQGFGLAIALDGQDPFADPLFNVSAASNEQIERCGYRKTPGDWTLTSCYREYNPKIKWKHFIIWYCSQSCSPDWRTSGKITNYPYDYDVAGNKQSYWYLTFRNGIHQGRDNDIYCNEFKGRTQGVSYWQGSISQSTQCGFHGTPQGGWDSGFARR